MRLLRYWNLSCWAYFVPMENGKWRWKFILIGDHKQLPPSSCRIEQSPTGKPEDCLLSDWRTWKILILKDCIAVRQHTMPISLRYVCRQGRMHPEVALFAIKAFYEGRLLPVGLPHQLEDSEDINRLVFYPSQVRTDGIASAKNKPFWSKDCSPSGSTYL